MIVPVAIYLALNAGRSSAHGFGVAMSTDTAFALGMLALVGPHFPDRLRAFMLTVVVVDDIVAIGVIAVVYTEQPRRRRPPAGGGPPDRAAAGRPRGLQVGAGLRSRSGSRRGSRRGARVSTPSSSGW